MPIIVIVHGEGGSGGALGIAVGDRVLMQEFAIYSVIPPEGCAAILWRDAGRKVEAAEALKITAPDLMARGIVDGIIPEPLGGAHHDHDRGRAPSTRRCGRALRGCRALDAETRLEARYDKFRAHRRLGAEISGTAPDRDTAESPARCDADLGPPSRATRRPRERWPPRSTCRRSSPGCCAMRGLDDPEAARRFLSPSLDHLHDPFLLTDMRQAVERLVRGARAARSASRSTATTTSTASPPR